MAECDKSKRKTKFNADILKENDCNGDVIGFWCSPGFKEEEARCIVCNSIINCAQHGSAAVKRHASLKGHIQKCTSMRDSTGKLSKPKNQQLFLVSNKKTGTLWDTVTESHADKVTSAEVRFALTVAIEHIPYSSGEAIANLIPFTFHDSKIARDFSCSRKKLSYLISDALGPHFKDEIINEVHKTNVFFSIQVDETPIPEKRVQQMDVMIRYYSDSQDLVVSEYLASYHLGSATADIMFRQLKETLNLLPSDKMLCFYSDGPNVMKSLHEKLKNINPDILDVGKCSLHKVHNAFSAGLSVFLEVETFCMDVYLFFKNSAVRSEDLRSKQVELGLPENIFLRHVRSRWLTLQLAVTRVLEQFHALKLFFKGIDSGTVRQTGLHYNRICEALTDKSLYAKLLFLKNASALFTGFLKLFQQQGPLVHIMYDEMVELIKKMMGRFLEAIVYINKSGTHLKKIDLEKKWLPKPEIGKDTQNAIMKLSEKEQKEFLMNARLFYIRSVKKLVGTLPLENIILKNLQCLHPLARTESFSGAALRLLATQMPNVVEASQISTLMDEWTILQTEDIDSSLFLKNAEPLTTDEQDNDAVEEELCETDFVRLDIYWRHIFQMKNNTGKVKFPLITRVVKALMCLPHGNADVERGFSQNKLLLSNRSNLNICSINGLRVINSYMKRFEDNPKKLLVTKQILKSAREAFNKYRQRCAATLQTTLKRSLETKDELKDLLDSKKLISNQLTSSQKMLADAEKLISEGLIIKDFSKIESGQVILKESKIKIGKYVSDLQIIEAKIDKFKNDAKKAKRE